MKRRLLLGMALVGVGFFALFGLRLGYGYLALPDEDTARRVAVSAAEPSFHAGRNNYASQKLKRSTARPATVDQKYEKVASLATTSDDFKDDTAAVRRAVGAQNGLVQFEQRGGLPGARVLHLAVGVDPPRFDALVASLRGIGDLNSVRVHKVDKTNSYKELKAKQASLVKTRAALTGLKGGGGRIDDLIRLEDRILAIEERIQELGIDLGEYDAENEFCTVKLTLSERRAAVAGRTIPLWQRSKVAFEWAVPLYLRLLGIAFVGAVLVLVCLLIAQRLRPLLTSELFGGASQ